MPYEAEKGINSNRNVPSSCHYSTRNKSWTLGSLFFLSAVLVVFNNCQQTQAALIIEEVLNAPVSTRIVEPESLSAPFPTMVTIPSGTFQMGCYFKKQCRTDERPLHLVKIQRFYMSTTEITFAQWDACVAAGACSRPEDKGWGRNQRPVINVSWQDIQQDYLPWVNKMRTDNASRGDYRLPTEAEWEYAVRAGSKTRYSWGNNIFCSDALYGYGCGEQKKTAKVARYAANSFGLYDMHGNVWEWLEDCWHSNYNNAPKHGYPAWKEVNEGDCSRRLVRGGSWVDDARYLRSAFRFFYWPTLPSANIGFRIVQSYVP